MGNGATAWSNYWQKGFLTTFVGSESDYYSGDVRRFWNSCFSKVPDGGAIVDICAGNGAVLALAVDYMEENGRKFNLIALDYADITGSSFYTKHPYITLLSNTPAEQTGLGAETIDLCVSQFGFEYSDTAATIKELHHILKPDGQFCALLHHNQSEVTIDAEIAVTQIALCERSELTETTAKLLTRLHMLRERNQNLPKDKKALQLREEFNRVAQRLLQYIENAPSSGHIDYFLNELANLFGSKAKGLDLQEKIAIIERLQADSSQYQSRMAAMLEASSDNQEIFALKESLNDVGFEMMNPEVINKAQQPLAWSVSCTKPATL